MKMTPSGQQVATLSIATSESYTDKQGQRQEKTEWHNVVVWNKNAEHAVKYLRKGRRVHIEGKLQTRSWDDQNGQKRYTTEIVCTQMTFVDAGGDGGGRQGRDPNAAASSGQDVGPYYGQPGVGKNQPSGPDSFPDNDVPF